MKNKVNPDLWEPIVTSHPNDIGNITAQPPVPHIFNPSQEGYEKYEVPGIMPKAPNSPKERVKPY